MKQKRIASLDIVEDGDGDERQCDKNCFRRIGVFLLDDFAAGGYGGDEATLR